MGGGGRGRVGVGTGGPSVGGRDAFEEGLDMGELEGWRGGGG